MSRIDELLADLCPSGVQFAAIGSVAECCAGATPSKQVPAYWENGTIPWLSSGEVNKGTIYEADTFISQPGYESCSTRMIPSGAVVMALAGQGKTRGMVARTRLDCCTNQSLASIITTERLNSDFLFYFLETQYEKLREVSSGDGTRGGLNLRMIRDFKVPVPPLEVQGEIVSILDTMAGLQAELQAELQARRHQYSYHWNELLTPGEGWRRVTIGQVADVFDGPHATPKKTDSGPWYLSISSLVNGHFDMAQSAHLGTDQYDAWTRRVTPQVGDTMFSYETRLGQAAYWDCNEPAALGRRMGLLRPRTAEILPPFLTLAYLGPEFQALIRTRTVRGATVDRIPIADLASWQISIPSMAEQRRIVDLLDKFGTLVNDLSIGLPAELTARRKQYEYYRDRLLTFKELAA